MKDELPRSTDVSADLSARSRTLRRAFLRRSAVGAAGVLLARDAAALETDRWQIVPASRATSGSVTARTVAMPDPVPVAPVVPANPADDAQGLRHLALVSAHTGETFDGVYCVHGTYVDGQLAEIAHVMRDHRAGEEHAMDPELLDLLVRLHARLDTDQPFRLLSGYRTKATNDSLRAHSSGVALHSLHMEAKAADIHVPGIPTKALRQAALGLRAGGVGYYSRSGFVHVDTGLVRSWGS